MYNSRCVGEGEKGGGAPGPLHGTFAVLQVHPAGAGRHSPAAVLPRRMFPSGGTASSIPGLHDNILLQGHCIPWASVSYQYAHTLPPFPLWIFARDIFCGFAMEANHIKYKVVPKIPIEFLCIQISTPEKFAADYPIHNSVDNPTMDCI